MRNWFSIPMRQVTATLLVASLLVCCCHARFILGGMPDEADGAAVASAPSCCSGAGFCERNGDDSQNEDTDQDEPGPMQGCKSCCVKGSGLKNGSPVLPATVIADLPAFDLPTSFIVPDAVGRDFAPRILAARPHVEPRTLVRLHCALVV